MSSAKRVVIVVSALPRPSAVAAKSRFWVAGKIDDGTVTLRVRSASAHTRFRLSLPAASKLTTDLEHHRLVRRREDPEDRRRTVVDLDPQTGERVRAWLEQRDRPLERALAALSPDERAAFLKGLRALAEALKAD